MFDSLALQRRARSHAGLPISVLLHLGVLILALMVARPRKTPPLEPQPALSEPELELEPAQAEAETPRMRPRATSSEARGVLKDPSREGAVPSTAQCQMACASSATP